MWAIVRSVLGVVAGFVVASIIMMVVETVNGKVLYPELGKSAQGVTDREEIKQIMATAPNGALVVVLIGWVLGSIGGGAVTTLICRGPSNRHALVLGCLLTLAGIVNNLMLPPPLWFWIATFVVFLPSTWLGARLVRQTA